MAMERDLCDNHWSKELVFRLAKHAKLKIVEVLKATPFHFVDGTVVMASHLIFKCRHEHHEPSPLFSTSSNIIIITIIFTIIIVIIAIITVVTTIITIIIGFLLPPRCSKSCFACHTFPWKFLHVQPGGSFGRRQRCEDALCLGKFTHRNGTRQQLLVLVCW